jgi:hypothetical protein
VTTRPERPGRDNDEEEINMKFVGLLLAVLGWLIPVLGLTLTASTGARLTLSVVGIAICLVGILGFVNGAYLKHAIWKQ